MRELRHPQTKYDHYTDHELLGLYDQAKTDPDYVMELHQRLAGKL